MKAVRAATLAGEDFHLVAALQFMAQWHRAYGLPLLRCSGFLKKVCIWKAKSSAVQPAGMVLISPLGVKTKISAGKEVELDGIEEVHGVGLRIVEESP